MTQHDPESRPSGALSYELSASPPNHGKDRQPEKLRTRNETAEILRVSVRTVDSLRARGELRATTIMGRVLFRQSELDRFIELRTEAGKR